MKKVLALILTVIMAFGCAFSASAVTDTSIPRRWGDYQDRQLKKLLVASQELDESGKTKSYSVYTYDDDGKIITATVYENEKKAKVVSTTKYSYTNGNKKVTIEEFNSNKKLVKKSVVEYPNAFDVLCNFDGQPFNKSTTESYDSNGKVVGKAEVTYSNNFKECSTKTYATSPSGKMYLSREIVEKFNKSCFNYASVFSRIYEKFVDFDESGKIISGREHFTKVDSHGNPTEETTNSYDQATKDFVFSDKITNKYLYKNNRISEKIYTFDTDHKYKEVYTYKDNAEEVVSYYYNEPDYILMSKKINNFDKNGMLLTSKDYTYVEETQTWILTDDFNGKYDSKGRNTLIEQSHFSILDGEKNDGYKTEMKFDKYGSTTLRKQSSWNPDTKKYETNSYSKYILTYSDSKTTNGKTDKNKTTKPTNNKTNSDAPMKSPKTGDADNMTIWFVLLSVAFVGIVGCNIANKKKIEK